jgi:cell division protein FtsB
MFHNPSPVRPAPKARLTHQVLTTPWLSVVLMVSGLFLVMMMGLTVWGDRGLLAMWRKHHELDVLAREIETIEQENAVLTSEMQRLRKDPQYIEKIAREELGLVRPGEIVFEFPK